MSDPFDPLAPQQDRDAPRSPVPDSGFAAATGGRLTPGDDEDFAAVDAFAPMTEEEEAAEERVAAALRSAGRTRLLLVAAAVLTLVGLVVGVRLLLDRLRGEDDAVGGGLVFDEVSGAEAGADLGPPVAEPLLVARLGTLVAVRAGDGPAVERVDPAADPALAPVPPGTLAATVLARDGTGQVLVTGPDGWLGAACVRASVVSATLRPFDSVWWESVPGACTGLEIGRQVVPTCLGPATVMLPIDVPAGVVELEEGGSAAADGVRVSVAAAPPGYQEVSVRGTIAVPDETEGVRIPGFSGPPGAVVEVPLGGPGAGLVGACTLI